MDIYWCFRYRVWHYTAVLQQECSHQELYSASWIPSPEAAQPFSISAKPASGITPSTAVGVWQNVFSHMMLLLLSSHAWEFLQFSFLFVISMSLLLSLFLLCFFIATFLFPLFASLFCHQFFIPFFSLSSDLFLLFSLTSFVCVTAHLFPYFAKERFHWGSMTPVASGCSLSWSSH